MKTCACGFSRFDTVKVCPKCEGKPAREKPPEEPEAETAFDRFAFAPLTGAENFVDTCPKPSACNECDIANCRRSRYLRNKLAWLSVRGGR